MNDDDELYGHTSIASVWISLINNKSRNMSGA